MLASDFPAYLYATGIPVVIDGDTVRVDIDMGFRCWTRQVVRLGGINAPEIHTPEGIAARDALIAHIATAQGAWHIQTYKDGKDKYGRYLATVFMPDGSSLNDWLISAGFAREWNGVGIKSVP